jgi:hypothetical protein
MPKLPEYKVRVISTQLQGLVRKMQRKIKRINMGRSRRKIRRENTVKYMQNLWHFTARWDLVKNTVY